MAIVFMNKTLTFILHALSFLLLTTSLPLLADLPDRFDDTWFEDPGIAKGTASCSENKCTCADQVLEWKDTSFTPRETWEARTAKKIVFLWNDFEKKKAIHTLSYKKFEPRLIKLKEKKSGHPRRIKSRQDQLQRDYDKVVDSACKILNAQKFFQINYPLRKKDIENREKTNLSSSEKNRVDFLRENLEYSITDLRVPRKKITLTSPIVTGSYKENLAPYVLPIVDSSWLESPMGVEDKVQCSETQCTCGTVKRIRINDKPAEELTRVYMKGFLAGHWRKFLKKKRDVERTEKDNKHFPRVKKEMDEAGCKLKLALYFVKVLNKDFDKKIEVEYHKAINAKKLNQPHPEKNPHQISSKAFHKLKKAMIFYAQTSKEDYLLK